MIDPSAKIANARRLLESGRTAQAEADLRRALAQAPGHPDLNAAMAMVMNAAGSLDRALYFMQRALAARPDDLLLLTNTGMLLSSLGRRDDAAPLFSRVLAADPRNIEARLGLAIIYRTRSEYTAAARELEAALAVNPDDASLAATYGAVLGNLARAAESASFLGHWLQSHADALVASMHAHAMNYAPGASPRDIFEAHLRFGRLLPSPPSAPFTNAPDPNRPLRVGILSNDLRRHSVASFLEPLLQHADRARIQITCYDNHPTADDITARLRTRVPQWRPCSTLDDPALAALIRADAIDILIETSGLTRGHRLAALALRPAPIQVTYCGYPCTTGVPAIDSRIVDSTTDPADAPWLGPERLERLDPVFLCYQPPDVPLTCGPSARQRSHPLTFGSFNAAAKLNDSVIALWTRILRECPDSRLVLKAFDFVDAPLRSDIAARFTGIDPARIEVLPPAKDPADHLRTYERIDIALDTFPYSGTTTTCEALWMGVPVVTLVGHMHAGRVGLSLLNTVGLSDLATSTEDHYAAAALALARDPDRRARLRASLRATMAASPLCDGPAFARRFERLLRDLWTRWCRAQGAPA